MSIDWVIFFILYFIGFILSCLLIVYEEIIDPEEIPLTVLDYLGHFFVTFFMWWAIPLLIIGGKIKKLLLSPVVIKRKT